MPRHDEHEFLNTVLQGNQEALSFCESLFAATQVIDDLIDRDMPISDDEIFRTFWVCLFELPVNPFFRKNEIYLRPIISAAFQDWWDSVKLERGSDDHGKTLAFVLRDNLASVVIACAYCIGGYTWMQEVSEQVRRHAHEDELHEYMADLSEGEIS